MEHNFYLPINIYPDIISSLRKAFPVYILSTKKNFFNWFFSKYVLSIATIWKDGSSDFDLVDWCDYYPQYISGQINKLLNISYLPPFSFQDMKEFILYSYEIFEKEIYLVVFVDEYFIPYSKMFRKNHYMHEYLIYGINQNIFSFLAIGFNKKGKMDFLNIKFTDLWKGITNFDLKNRHDLPINNVQYIKLEMKKFNFSDFPDIAEYKMQLRNYITSEYRQKDQDIVSLTYPDTIIYGINTYDILYYHIKNIILCNEPNNFRFIHSFWEHKKGIYNSMKYLSKNESCQYILNRYNESVLSPLQNLRLCYLKTIMTNINSYDLETLKDKIYKIKNNEYRILREFYQFLDSNLW